MRTLGPHNYYVYIVTNLNKTVLYTGITNNLKQGLYFHINPLPFSKAFTTKYKCYHLIYYDHFFNVEVAIKREKQIKGQRRLKKDNLISGFNPEWGVFE